jgi:hypothetical protein
LDIDNEKSVGGAGCDRRSARATGRKRAGDTKAQQAQRDGAAIEAKRMWHTWPSQLAANGSVVSAWTTQSSAWIASQASSTIEQMLPHFITEERGQNLIASRAANRRQITRD